jgi:LysR family hydrogen peroxide-inducible transcriptional activator
MAAALKDVSLRQLEYVVAVADTLGFRRAAERCHVSQPTLSAQVQQLEAVLGVRIFERGRRGVLVTRSGEEIVALSRRVLSGVGDVLAAATRARDPLRGGFRVGVIPTVAPYLLPEVTPALQERYPELRLVFREEKTELVMRELHEGGLDFALVALEADLGDHEAAIVARDPFVVALPRGHRLAAKKRVAVQDLDGETVLLLDDGHCFRAQALGLCAKAGAREAELRATSLATLVQMVPTIGGVTLLPELSIGVENRRGQLEIRPFTPPVPTRTIALVWRPSAPFADALREIAGVMRVALEECAAR